MFLPFVFTDSLSLMCLLLCLFIVNHFVNGSEMCSTKKIIISSSKIKLKLNKKYGTNKVTVSEL